jgi:hypothetical protein
VLLRQLRTLREGLNDPINGTLQVSVKKGRGTVTGTIVENSR